MVGVKVGGGVTVSVGVSVGAGVGVNDGAAGAQATRIVVNKTGNSNLAKLHRGVFNLIFLFQH